MVEDKTWRWQFLAFESRMEGRPVQDWFDPLPDDDKWEITDLLDTLQKATSSPWPDAIFDQLRGAAGISEIKVPNIRCLRQGKVTIITYRIYGYFGPNKRCYTFLHGTEKGVRNDTAGKQIAERRLREVTQHLGTGMVSVYEFEFEESPD